MSGTTLATGDNSDSQLLTSSTLPRVSAEEAIAWYAALPSRNPLLVARTGSVPYVSPTGPEAYTRRKELLIVGEHKIQDFWEDDLAPKVHAILDEKQVEWTSTDVVRLGYIDKPHNDELDECSVLLWIGVIPGSLSYERGIDVALRCERILLDYGIEDVNVEIRESSVIRAARPKLFEPVGFKDPTVEFRELLSHTLGIPICAQSTPEVEGTGGFFLNEGGANGRLLLVTARHVVFPDAEDNELFEHQEGSPRHDVLTLSDASLQKHLEAILRGVWGHDGMIEHSQRRIASKLGRDDDKAVRVREHAQKEGEEAEAAAESLTDYHEELSTHWATQESRILGHVIFSPPISVGSGAEQYTQDVAVIAVDPGKVDPQSFAGNVIDLGVEFKIFDYMRMMPPNPKSSHNFRYPFFSRSLSLRGTITDEELRKPTTYDKDDNPRLTVLKRGVASGLTVGRANGISYTRDELGRVSKQWAILPVERKAYNNVMRCNYFAEEGDSGSVVVDGAGRIGGIITCGAGKKGEWFDLTYVTPIGFVIDAIRGSEALAKAYPREGPVNEW